MHTCKIKCLSEHVCLEQEHLSCISSFFVSCMCDCPTQVLPLPIPHHHTLFWTACCFPCNRKLWAAFQQTPVKVSITVFEITLVFTWGKVLPSRKPWTAFKNSTPQIVPIIKIYLNICLCVKLASCPHQVLNENLVEYSKRLTRPLSSV